MNSASKIEEQAAQWIARRDGTDWTERQQTQLDAWIALSIANRVAYLRLDSVWRRADRLSSLHVSHTLSVSRPGFAWPHFSTWRMAASVLLVVTVGSFVGYTQLLRPGTAYSSALGESKSVALPDGSRVALNTSTQLRARMTGEARTVWLENGEAYFEVTHDAKRPFVVEAGASRVTVLGTKFTVRRDGDQVKVTVVDGRVTVSPVRVIAEPKGNTDLARVIGRNDVLLANTGHMDVVHLKPEQVANQLGWRQGKVVLDDFTLAQAAAEFNRYNRVKLVVVDATAGQMPIGGSFNVDNVEGFARMLHAGFGLKVEIGEDEIRILR